MGHLRMVSKKEPLQFVAVPQGSATAETSDRESVGGGLKLKWGSFSIELAPGFDQRTLEEVLHVIKSSQC